MADHTYRHRKTFDLSSMPKEHRDALQAALNDDDREWGQLVDGKVPVDSQDLRRMTSILEGHDGTVHVVEADSEGRARHGVVIGAGTVPLHVVWDPRPGEPQGAISMSSELFDEPDSAGAFFMGATDLLLDRAGVA